MRQISVSPAIIDLGSKLFRDRRLAIAAWIVIGLQCLVATWLFKPWAIGDSFHYLALARNLVDGHYGTVTQAGFEADPLRPPGYPIILWLLKYVVDLPDVVVVLVQLAAYCASIYALQRYLQRIGVNPIPFVVIVALYPFPLLYSTFLLTESWVIVMTVLTALCLIRRDRIGYFLSGMFSGMGGLIRADLILLPILLCGVILLISRGVRSWSSRVGMALLPLIGAALVATPYAAWNYTHFGRFTPLPRAGAVGTSLLLTTYQRDLTPDDIAALEDRRYTPHVQQLGMPQTFKQIDREIGAPADIGGFDPYNFPTAKLRMAASQAYLHVALKRIVERPGFYANHVVHNLWELWVTKKYAPKLSSAPKIGGLIIAGLAIVNWGVFVFGMLGLATASIQPLGWRIPRFLVPVTLYPAGIHMWLHTEARYTAATRPLLVMFSAAFLVWICRRYLDRPMRASSMDQEPLIVG